MDYPGLRAFVVVAQEGNLTRAAERLHVTQPALSLQLKRLQTSLGVTLFERMPRGMRLTETGRKLLPAAERALAAATEFRAAAVGLKGSVTGLLRLGTIVDPEFLRLGSCLRQLAERHPGLTFALQHGMSGAMSREVEAGHCDVAFALGPPGLDDLRERFHVLSLTSFAYRVVAPPGWAGQVRGKGWRDLAPLPWIGTPPESVHSRLLGRIASAEHVTFNQVAQVDLEPSMMDLVTSGVALALARDSLALRAAHANGVAIADAVTVPAELGLICRKERYAEPPIKAALETVGEVWRSEHYDALTEAPSPG
jgi:DNA-binding transcriptional LysR family regulator